MIEGIIYCYHSPSNKYYIGQTIHESKRKRQHIQLSNTGDNAYFHKAIRKHGFENFKYSVLFHFSSLNKDRVKVVLNALEIYYINKYRREGKTLYNTCQGGNCAYNINTFNHNTIAAYLKRYGGECNYKGYTWRYKK